MNKNKNASCENNLDTGRVQITNGLNLSKVQICYIQTKSCVH